ncbi:hypothetical protein [Ectorhizobium quercum]|uniref:hypothetical protein n=1 Tax=Ectorhizobium quercum TaxID=2965071 RepID=UPI00352059C7
MHPILRHAALACAFSAVATSPLLAQSPAQEPFSSFRNIDSTMKSPKMNAFVDPALGNNASANIHEVFMEARLTPDGEPVQEGLVWRVFSPVSGDDGKLPLLASAEGGSADFQLAPGDYYVNVTFGRAGATKKLTVAPTGDTEQQVLVLDAGGVVLNGIAGSDSRIPPEKMSFSIYSSDVQDDGERGLVVANVRPNTIVRLNTGTYHIVSEYGNVNSVVRANIQVEAGKLTEATLQHRAAQVSLKLVSDEGGEAIADTAWSVLTSAGDSVSESVSAFPTLVLAEGEYVAIARNKERIYQRNFTVEAGRNIDVELLLDKHQMRKQDVSFAEDL